MAAKNFLFLLFHLFIYIVLLLIIHNYTLFLYTGFYCAYIWMVFKLYREQFYGFMPEINTYGQ